MKTPRTAIIIGAGVIGIASAYALIRRGVQVTLIDGHQETAMGASKANGAQLSYAYSDALANPRILASLPKFALGRDEAFRFHWKWDVDYLRWLLRFLGNCTASKFQSNTLATLALAVKSRNAMGHLLINHNLEFGHRLAGKMHLYRNRDSFLQAQQVKEMKGLSSSDQQILCPEEAIGIEPALQPLVSDLAGVIYSPKEEVGDANIFSRNLLYLMTSDYGLKSILGRTVEKVKLKRDRAEVVMQGGGTVEADVAVVCTGAQAQTLIKPHKVCISVAAMKGYSFTAPLGKSAPNTSITDTEKRIVFTNLGDKIRVAGIADMGDDSEGIAPGRIASLIASARASLPEAADYQRADQYWSGLRPMTPNSLPIIERPRSALAINAGHGMLGWTLAMGSAERLAEVLEVA